MQPTISYKFFSPQSSKIIDKILEIDIIELDFNEKLILTNPEVLYWSYKLHFENEILPCQDSLRPEFLFYPPCKYLFNKLLLSIIDLDDGSEVCRLIIEGLS